MFEKLGLVGKLTREEDNSSFFALPCIAFDKDQESM
jgi:hypothetical protein